MAVLPDPCRWDLPDPAEAAPGEDVVAIGADLEVSTVFEAYCRGMFPMHMQTGDLAWWSPDPRGVLPLDGLRVTRSLRQSMKSFTFSVDRDFVGVMRECADERRDSGWITDEFIDTYTALHRMGWAHSVEVWRGGDLVGGLYGIEIGGLFAGESMFHRATDASKAALVVLVDLLGAGGGDRVLDVQWRTEHLASMGAVEIPRTEYLARLSGALPLAACLAAGTNG
ncbi:MAG: leucyl/phenylalanyl-tRNA--protein transferase [Actinobacteria bacterium]|nr:leucyl/phenylalanyl-tRNA--protein transferase [Actinomycetota bacterium]